MALVHADGDTPLARALYDLSRTARRGSAAVIITPSARADWLPALLQLAQSGIQSNVILLERATFGGEGNSQALQDAVRQAGANCHLVRQGDVGRPPEQQEQRGFWEFKTLATGKVIVVKRPET